MRQLVYGGWLRYRWCYRILAAPPMLKYVLRRSSTSRSASDARRPYENFDPRPTCANFGHRARRPVRQRMRPALDPGGPADSELQRRVSESVPYQICSTYWLRQSGEDGH